MERYFELFAYAEQVAEKIIDKTQKFKGDPITSITMSSTGYIIISVSDDCANYILERHLDGTWSSKIVEREEE